MDPTGHGLTATDDDMLEAKELAATYSLETVHDMMKQVYKAHRKDPNFPLAVLEKIEDFLSKLHIIFADILGILGRLITETNHGL